MGLKRKLILFDLPKLWS